ncbi:sensor histidine kinase [Phreatobacter stygius]|uniref:histidine kinase n=1 Tax=Phreatobacter stygius TaxID=1940610 RepID=A0A4D7AZ93_9HYPH|nr:HAMP domain-containing sensor histidine kinase [Phreatobacter stygius]QCI64103.1 HAMP domain-containing histidine kinase [Phreatobacter stygius]
MIFGRVRSLKWRLVWRLVLLQGAMLALLLVLAVGTLWATGYLIDEPDEDAVADAVQVALTRDAEGRLMLRRTKELVQLRQDSPNLWFIVRDRQGQVLSEGQAPPEFARIGDALDHISQARLGWQIGDEPGLPTARVKRVDTAAGNVQIISGSGGKLLLRKLVLGASILFLSAILPNLVLMTLATIIATSMVVRRALAGLGEAAAEAERIDIDKRGMRLPADTVPTEVTPLVKAVNDALGRLDEGYERHKRFLVDAAHELRTPIAILQTRLEALPQTPDKTRLLEDIARLANLAEQLLDLQRLNQRVGHFAPIDLVTIGRRVATDLAPLAIAAGYELSFDTAAQAVPVMGDQAALERALTNLVQNAIQHGGRRGAITIAVTADGSVEVADEGDGIPADQHERIFEPFHRLTPLDRGAGLGLNLVREIADIHGGDVSVFERPGGGACFRLTVPRLARPSPGRTAEV